MMISRISRNQDFPSKIPPLFDTSPVRSNSLAERDFINEVSFLFSGVILEYAFRALAETGLVADARRVKVANLSFSGFGPEFQNGPVFGFWKLGRRVLCTIELFVFCPLCASTAKL